MKKMGASRGDFRRAADFSFILHPSSLILPPMPAEAPVSSIWKKQKFFVSLFLLAVGGWFFWDGAIGYPRSNERYTAWKTHLDEGRGSEWPSYADKFGWERDEWPKYVREHHPTGHLPMLPFPRDKIVAQFVFGGLAALIGAIVLAYWATQIRRVLRTDDEAVYSPAGTRVPFGAITGLGKKKWESKGFATVRYTIDGKQGQFVIDDYKFETEPTRAIVAEIEAKLGAG